MKKGEYYIAKDGALVIKLLKVGYKKRNIPWRNVEYTFIHPKLKKVAKHIDSFIAHHYKKIPKLEVVLKYGG